ncbi:acetyl-CoA C-acetyltransferase [Bacillus siamensis]|uniref:acetyl-CoA C-acetyltransferase n=1 Tax=Bacillus siamensis TaxID=659243 RepID=UPI002E2182F7|nr:acetyl-CoA C-acetyltransferase [Bacillus siamensis]MED0771941.1 acetyl-CoA C-acetyltransferase [Bacillus siamensis]MED0776837.1 acetyl-CoA C-acetyltransferase [Bacillus siamensis]MED0780530.1 acetyl-CoA C-acetyltransferase [Bacillus siamensis]MED0833349.1 acetyl-CoA C-acetyltransferase [Bacillus siamensis]
MGKTVIVSAARTPFGKFGGALKEVKAAELGGIAIKEAIKRAGIGESEAEGAVMGMVVQAGAGQIPARQAARYAGLPWSVPAETINKVCASGLRAVTFCDQIIRANDADVLIAGGMESMSNIPYAIPAGRWGIRMGDGVFQDLMVHDGLTCAFDQVHMAVHGSAAAEKYGISRDEQDNYALSSQKRAAEAAETGKLQEEIVPVTWTDKKGKQHNVTQDEGLRPDTSLEQLAKLKPIFTAGGTVTAGNAPGVNDGAGAFVLMSEEKAAKQHVRPLAAILGFASVGLEASELASAPGEAISRLLKKTGLSVDDIDLFEVNEAFASVVLVSEKIARFSREKVNVNGGAIAFGHPIGASGARIIMSLIYELKRRGGGLGIAAICSGAAQGDAVLLEVY